MPGAVSALSRSIREACLKLQKQEKLVYMGVLEKGKDMLAKENRKTKSLALSKKPFESDKRDRSVLGF